MTRKRKLALSWLVLLPLAVVIALQLLVSHGFTLARMYDLVTEGTTTVKPVSASTSYLAKQGEKVVLATTKPPEATPGTLLPPMTVNLQTQGKAVQSALRCRPGAGNKIALTFDDGPSPMTPAYLEVLQQEGVHATFFMVGRQVKRYPAMAATIARNGEEIGDHSYNHPNLKLLSAASVASEITSTASLIEAVTDEKPYLFRPPGGNCNATVINVAQNLGMKTVLWNIDPRDWAHGATSNQIVSNILNNLRPGSIVVMHEGKPQTLAALPLLIRTLKQNGWQVVTVSNLLGSSAPQTVPVLLPIPVPKPVETVQTTLPQQTQSVVTPASQVPVVQPQPVTSTQPVLPAQQPTTQGESSGTA